MTTQTRPGRGWKQNAVNSSVWHHESGMRLHLLGLLLMPNGDTRNANFWPEFQISNACVKIAGGNRKRGLMIWATGKLQDS